MHTLIATLGGLINRRVFYLPISRAVYITSSGTQVVQRMLETCKKEGGVLLVQPEHLLSFKFMAWSAPGHLTLRLTALENRFSALTANLRMPPKIYRRERRERSVKSWVSLFRYRTTPLQGL